MSYPKREMDSDAETLLLNIKLSVLFRFGYLMRNCWLLRGK